MKFWQLLILGSAFVPLVAEAGSIAKPKATEAVLEKPKGKFVSQKEVIKIKDGELKNLKSGLRLKLKTTDFESFSPKSSPEISTPAVSRFTIVIEAKYGDQSQDLYFVPASPGIVSQEDHDFTDFRITYNDHKYEKPGGLVVEFSVEKLK